MPTISLTLDAANTARVIAAFKWYWGQDTDPTQAELKEFLRRQLVGVVRQYEQSKAVSEAAVVDPIVT